MDQTSSDKVDDRLVIDVIKDAFTQINKLSVLLKKYEDIMANPDSQEQYDKTLERYCRLIEEFGNIGGYDIDVKIGTVCSGLNIDNNMLYQTYATLSGGEKH